MPDTFLAAKTAVAAAVLATAASATVAAAYTGTLPEPLQNAAHHTIGAPAAEHHKPSPSKGAHSASPTSRPTRSASRQGPDATGEAAFGLCNAFTHGGLATTSTAYRNLATAAGGADEITAYCATVPNPGDATGSSGSHATGRPTGSPTGRPATHPTGQPSDHGAGNGKPNGNSGNSGNHGTGRPSDQPIR